MTNIYVFAYSGYDSNAILIRAQNEDEALGKILSEYGYKPTGELLGTVDEVMDTVNIRKLV